MLAIWLYRRDVCIGSNLISGVVLIEYDYCASVLLYDFVISNEFSTT
jgi:hypothetical protein